MGVPAVNDQVSLFKVGQDHFDEAVHNISRLYHQHDLPGTFQPGYKLLHGVGTVDGVPAFGRTFQEIVYLAYGPIENRHLESLVVHVEDEVLSHNRQADEADIRFFFRHNDSLYSYSVIILSVVSKPLRYGPEAHRRIGYIIDLFTVRQGVPAVAEAFRVVAPGYLIDIGVVVTRPGNFFPAQVSRAVGYGETPLGRTVNQVGCDPQVLLKVLVLIHQSEHLAGTNVAVLADDPVVFRVLPELLYTRER